MRRFLFWTKFLWLILSSCLFPFPSTSLAGDWPGWRGPTGLGYTDEKDLPLTWGGPGRSNILWRMPLGGKGYSSPIVWRDRVFATTAAEQTEEARKQEIPEHHV